MARQTALPVSLPPIGATREVAAAYVSLSPAKFQELVDRRLFPCPKRIDGRLIWDLEEVRLRFKALPAEGTADDSWSDVDAS
jgi:hypothetical protein